MRLDRSRSASPVAPQRRWVFRARHAASALLLGLGLLAAPHSASASDEPAIEDLGQPITSVTIADAAYGQGPDGEPWMYLLVRGTPAVLQVIDIPTGQRVHTVPLEGAIISWGIAVAPDGRLYIGSQHKGYAYRWNPADATLDTLGIAIEGETHHWEVAVDPHGRVYGGTYPSGKVFRYDPETDEFRDYGRIAEGEDYVRAVAASPTTVYAGTGARDGRLIAIDAESGELESIPLPGELDDAAQQVYRLRLVGNLLFAEIHPGPHFLIHDTRTGEWRGELGGLPSEPGPDGHLYFVDGDGLKRFDPETGSVESTSFSPPSDTRQFGWFDLDDPDRPGPSLVSTNMRGAYWIYNPATDQGENLVADTVGQPTPVRSTMVTPDDQLYVGGYLSPGMIARRDPDSGEFTPLPGVSQVEGFALHDGKIYMGVYPSAKILVYDPARPWNPDRNPRPLFFVGQDQDRPFAITSAGDHVAIGTVPVAGAHGGALTIYDPASDEVEVHRHVVHNQSIVSLTYRDGIVIGGSSASGGLGIPEVEKEGRLFYWDIAAKRVIWEGSPVPSTRSVTGLTFDDEGLLWGVADGHLFVFDPDSRRTIRSQELFPGRRPSPYIWVNGYLHFHEDGHLYGKVWDRVFRVDLDTWEVTELVRDAHYFSQDSRGDIFFGRGNNLYRLPYQKARPQE